MKRVISSTQYTSEDLTEMLEFLSDNFKVNGPSSAGARMPKFNAYAVNESEFGHNLRAKYYDCSISKNGKELDIYWLSQDPFDESEVEPFINEVSRWLVKRHDEYTESKGLYYLPVPHVQITVACRYGDDEGYYRTTI